MWWIGVIIGAVVFFFSFVRFTTTTEGTAKIIMRFGGIIRVFFQWTGYERDRDGNIKEKTAAAQAQEKKKFLGGLRVWIGLPVDKVHTYHLRWHSIELRGDKRVPVLHDEERMNSVMLKQDVYWMKALQVETKDGLFPDIEWGITMKVINPAKVIFRAPHNWVENVLTLFQGFQRQYAREKNMEEIMDLSKEDVWGEKGQDYLIKTRFKEEWGIEIVENGLEVFAITPPPAYQTALAARSKAEMEAEAKKRGAEVEAYARAEELLGTPIASVVRAEGRPEKKIQQEFKKNPKDFYKKHKVILDNTMTKLSMEERAYLRMETPGATGMEGAFLRLLGAWQRMPSGRTGKGEGSGSSRVRVNKEDVEKERESFKKTIEETSEK